MPAAPQTRFAENLRGAGFMSASMLGFALNDALMKFFAPEMGLFQAIFLRSCFALALVGALAWRFGALDARPPRRDLPWLVLRAGAEVGATVCYLTALMHMPMGNVSAIVQTMPLLITLVGALFLGETVGWRRWTAISAGFLGVLVIVRPGGADFDPHSGYAFAGMLFFMIRDLSTRKVSGDTPSLLITLATTAGVAVMGAVGVGVEDWTPVSGRQVAGLAAAAAAIFGGYYCGVVAMRRGEVAFSSPFRYSILCWALLLGWLIFDERPDALTLLGAAMIVAAGLYAFWRERVQARAEAPAAGAGADRSPAPAAGAAQSSAPPHALAPAARRTPRRDRPPPPAGA